LQYSIQSWQHLLKIKNPHPDYFDRGGWGLII